ncbi:MarR family winged helix-turn-helix transcriptional regulator [Chryseobacterium chendengshani]|uniref:MarR family winged helix-turn-helix transcriptional regulator n=1 Tax=unclassified Chryseobacterium TaxID=2593645 RepID=UPI001C63BAA8|nr:MULTISPECIES: MarR family transcriptional regulator [unclassified Chryseobacterium]MBW7673982.1 MarR family transcriptional regulator [Chryseobacterium sp. LJ756]MBW8523077.1 MarR family transcriptional regulator [Chryseobacterium sp. LJ668]QYK16604.1 MarR family transcriptional regulator [Chryseobacterium sp. LJ668]
MKNHDSPKLGNQLCFPFYVIAKEITGLYRPFLDELGITYSQYLVMMILWEKDGLTVNQIGEKLYLDSGTLTPLLKRLESKGFIIRKRKKEDERVVEIFLDDAGRNLQQKACQIPAKMQEKLNLTDKDLLELKETVQQILNKIQK